MTYKKGDRVKVLKPYRAGNGKYAVCTKDQWHGPATGRGVIAIRYEKTGRERSIYTQEVKPAKLEAPAPLAVGDRVRIGVPNNGAPARYNGTVGTVASGDRVRFTGNRNGVRPRVYVADGSVGTVRGMGSTADVEFVTCNQDVPFECLELVKAKRLPDVSKYAEGTVIRWDEPGFIYDLVRGSVPATLTFAAVNAGGKWWDTKTYGRRFTHREFQAHLAQANVTDVELLSLHRKLK